MLHFFQKTRNISGLTLLLSPLLCLLLEDRPYAFWLPFLGAAMAALVLLRAGLPHFRAKPLFALCTALAFASVTVFPNTDAEPILLGAGTAAPLLLLPPSASQQDSHFGMPIFLGLSWMCTFFSACVLYHLSAFDDTPDYIAEIILAAAGLLTIRLPDERSHAAADIILIPGRKQFLKPSFYAFCLGASIGTAVSLLCIASSDSNAAAFTLQDSAFWIMLSAAPFLAALLLEKKGAFSGSLLVLFFLQAPMLLSVFFRDEDSSSAGALMLVLACGTLPVIFPVLIHYICGYTQYPVHLARTGLWLPAGLFFTHPLLQQAQTGTLEMMELAILLPFLQTMSFFCIFFAWKQRFVILKNEII